MADPQDEQGDGQTLNERLLDLLVYAPVGAAVSLVEEFPSLAARGRDRLGVRVSSARAVGQFVVQAGHDEMKRRSERLFTRGAPPTSGRATSGSTGERPSGAGPVGPSTAPASEAVPVVSPPSAPNRSVPSNGHVPAVTTLSIPGFDTLSASQVVQRLDGLNRSELVSVRAYEASNRGRRTILSRVDQLLDERS
jgi:hypothetical protein